MCRPVFEGGIVSDREGCRPAGRTEASAPVCRGLLDQRIHACRIQHRERTADDDDAQQPQRWKQGMYPGDDGHMDQVQRVGVERDHAQRSGGERDRHPAAILDGIAEDYKERAALQGVANRLAKKLVPDGKTSQENGQGEQHMDKTWPPRAFVEDRILPQGEAASEENAVDPRVRPIIDLADVGYGRNGRKADPENRDARPQAQTSGFSRRKSRQYGRKYHRKYQVEMLFDREAPQRRSGDPLCVARNPGVVCQKDQLREYAPELGRMLGGKPLADPKDEQERNVERWQNAYAASDVKGLDINASGLCIFRTQKCGDQVTAQKKENRYTKATGNQSFKTTMRDKHNQNRKRPESIKWYYVV